MDAPANATKKTSPEVPEETAKPAALVHYPCGYGLAAFCGERALLGEADLEISRDRESITCSDCRQALGLSLGAPTEASGVDLARLDRQSTLRSRAANTAPKKG